MSSTMTRSKLAALSRLLPEMAGKSAPLSWNFPPKSSRAMSSLVGSNTNQQDQRRWAHQNLAFKREDNTSNENPRQSLVQDIHKLLATRPEELEEMSQYYFNAGGKFIRPRLTITMARAINAHLGINDPHIDRLQKDLAAISEMWHTSSLVHDDVIDHSESRRGIPSINQRWGAPKSIISGDYILGVGSKLLAQTKDPEVVLAMSQILTDLVSGEFQQMGSREDDEDRFQLYLDKSFNKTASLIANSCKAAALLSVNERGSGGRLRHPSWKIFPQMAYMYGRNIGLAFQLIDDYLDFVATADQLGKPAGADLELGLATAPVLFASREFPHLKELILRQFSQPGDVKQAFQTVLNSTGLEQTKSLAKKYAELALDDIKELSESVHKAELRKLAEATVERCS